MLEVMKNKKDLINFEKLLETLEILKNIKTLKYFLQSMRWKKVK